VVVGVLVVHAYIYGTVVTCVVRSAQFFIVNLPATFGPMAVDIFIAPCR
jgi:hypothetical protein